MPGHGPGKLFGVISVLARLAPALLSAWLLVAAQPPSGIRYHAEVEIPASISLYVSVEGDRARLEILQSNEPNLAAGTALITADRGEHLTILDTARQEFFSLPRAVIAQFKQRQAEHRRITSDPVTSELIAEDSGPALAGHSTRHVRYHIRLATHQPGAAGDLVTQIDVFEHVWLTADIAEPNTALAMLADSADLGVPALDEFLRNQLGELKGFALKRNLVVTLDDSVHHRVIRNSYEVTDLAPADSPESLFTVPEGFHVRVPQQAQSAPATPAPARP